MKFPWPTQRYLNLGGTFYYTCSILDGYSRFIVHSEIREQMTEQDVETILQRAREKYFLEKGSDEKPRIISDNGPQFISKDFKQFIRICGMTHVRTSPYYPQSNGKLERYHRTIKSECIRPGATLCLEDARRLVTNYVTEYNEVRLHSVLGYVTPADKLHERDRKLKEAREGRACNRRFQDENDQLTTQTDGCYTEDAWAEERAGEGHGGDRPERRPRARSEDRGGCALFSATCHATPLPIIGNFAFGSMR